MKRFWKKVDVKGPDECWEWKAGITEHGYGRFWRNKRKELAHRSSYEMHYGDIPKGEGAHGTCVCHSCDNRKCVNPEHLFLGSHTDNMQDMLKKGRGNRAKGEDSNKSNLREVDIINIRAIYKYTKASHRKLGEIYSVDHATIGHIVNRKTWKHIQ